MFSLSKCIFSATKVYVSTLEVDSYNELGKCEWAVVNSFDMLVPNLS
jgi:hypothetical protein